MSLVRVGHLAAVDLDRVRAVRVDGESATVFFAGGSESVSFCNRNGEWSGMVGALPAVGGVYPDQAQASPEPDRDALPPGTARIG